jgi:glycosyltransferase involved in cell wall biosynthesis
MIDLAIAYRIYPGISKTPAAWADDKFKLSTYGVRSFKQALGTLRIKMWVLLDGCPPEYEELFRAHFTEDELIVLNLNRIGNLPTFAMQVDLLSRQTEAELVYFAEDDYFYLPGALVEMVDFLRGNERADFVTPYDHSGNYDPLLGRERHLIKPFGKRHWRTCTATCLTFLARRESLLRIRWLFDTYAKGNEDGSIWMAVTQKTGLLNPRVYARNSVMFKLWLKAWFWGFRQILFGSSYSLWGPIPSLSTHLESLCLAPVVDWKVEFRRAEQGATGYDGRLDSGAVGEVGRSFV